MLTDLDLFLFGKGDHRRIYEKLGAHPGVVDGRSGTHFAVWAPNARAVSVVGPHNAWDGRVHRMFPVAASGIWYVFVPDVGVGAEYKYEILSRDGALLLKSDPYGFAMQLRPGNSSMVASLDRFEWQDHAWMSARGHTDPRRLPINVYEVHLASWKRPWDARTPPFMSWSEATEHLIPYVKDMGFTHLELMGVAEHPLDESWGYQVIGYYAATARYGSPQDFMRFVDACHRAGIGVFLDWVPAHFPRDECGLALFDGTALYEHADYRLGEHREWGTKVFNYGRHEVKNFLIANAMFWLDRFHIDGLRVDAVASMLYLDYSRSAGDWLPNRYGGRENLEAIDFLKHLNSAVAEAFPGTLTIAEESTAWPGVTRPAQEGGLGFGLKWNMGWMNDTLRYFESDPLYRRYQHHLLTFSFMYAWSESFILPISHDEVVHGKRSLLDKMPGDEWQKRANLRLLLSYMLVHPGKKLLFMGSELGQWHEWREAEQLDWAALTNSSHQGLQHFVRELNHLYARSPQLFQSDIDPSGFRWVDLHNGNESVWAFERLATGAETHPPYLCVFNGTPVPRDGYGFNLQSAGEYHKILDSDAPQFGGSGYNTQSVAFAEGNAGQAGGALLRLNLPPLGAMIFVP